MLDGSAYQVVSDKEMQRVSKMLREDLNQSPTSVKLDNFNTRLNKLNPNFDFGKGGLDNTQTYETGY